MGSGRTRRISSVDDIQLRRLINSNTVVYIPTDTHSYCTLSCNGWMNKGDREKGEGKKEGNLLWSEEIDEHERILEKNCDSMRLLRGILKWNLRRNRDE